MRKLICKGPLASVWAQKEHKNQLRKLGRSQADCSGWRGGIWGEGMLKSCRKQCFQGLQADLAWLDYLEMCKYPVGGGRGIVERILLSRDSWNQGSQGASPPFHQEIPATSFVSELQQCSGQRQTGPRAECTLWDIGSSSEHQEQSSGPPNQKEQKSRKRYETRSDKSCCAPPP